MNPFAPGIDAFVVYYVMGNRQEFQAAVRADVLPRLHEITAAAVARQPDGGTKTLIVELIAHEDVDDLDVAGN